MPVSHTSSEKFKTVAKKNVDKVDDALKKIGEVAVSEDFSKEDKEKIFKHIQKQITQTKKLFDLNKEDPHGFTL
mgnify:CR=1 FL=1|tara:strand:+ start:835 stop:1056 length:222 start_codon:yes stop_codon:yes gene_type:complete